MNQTSVVALTAVRGGTEKGARWFAGGAIIAIVVGFGLGFAASYAIYTRSFNTVVERISNIEQFLLQQQPTRATSKTRG